MLLCTPVISRHTVVCHAAQEAGTLHREILKGRKKKRFSRLCTSVISYPIGTTFATKVPSRKGSPHTKFEENRSSHFRDTSDQNFILIVSFFSSSFCTLHNIRHKTPKHAPIGLKFGILRGLIKADLSTTFGRNPMKIYGVMANYLHKIRLNFCHVHRVNCLEE